MSIWCGVNYHHSAKVYKGGKHVGWQCIVCKKSTEKPHREYMDRLGRTFRIAKSAPPLKEERTDV